jgi:DNA topoisomerase-3
MARKIELSNYQVGTIVQAASARLSAEKTSPPPYFTEASLLEAMVNAHQFATNEADRQSLKAGNGIGTARTRGEVIKELKGGKVPMIAVVGKGKKAHLEDTPAGRHLTKLAPSALKNVAMTAKWEVLFTKIEKGEVTHPQFKQVTGQFVTVLVDSVRQMKEKGGIIWNHAAGTKRK